MIKTEYIVRNAIPSEFEEVGKLMVDVYRRFEGFPKEGEQPNYYKMLLNLGELTAMPETEILVAVSGRREIAGAVVFFGDMSYYRSGGKATSEIGATGLRLLAVHPLKRGLGIGKLLANECIKRSKAKNRSHVILHTTMAMLIAWTMYEKMGFKRSEDLDFLQGQLPVFGFRLYLQ